MEDIKVRGQHIKVDVESELMEYTWGRGAKFSEDKLIAPSPFRVDHSPSFFVNLTGDYAGTWKDSGFEDETYASGSFVKLLAFLRSETYEESEDYLLYKYGTNFAYDNLSLSPPDLHIYPKRSPLPSDFLKPYKYRSQYLGNRRITEKVQRMMKIGYDRDSKAVVIPWINQNGEIANCKFRSTRSKVFWYAKDAVPIKRLVYGIDAIYGMKAIRAVICEAEIDALTWYTMGVPAMAVGGITFTDYQADIIRRSPVQELLICADNDDQGSELRSKVIDRLRSDLTLTDVLLPKDIKDANEALTKGVQADIIYKPINSFKKLVY